MGFNGSTMVMGDFSPNWREAWVNHAVTPRDAFGAGGVAMRSDNKLLTRNFSELTYTRLLHRINGEHSQANFWLVGGAGQERAMTLRAAKPCWHRACRLTMKPLGFMRQPRLGFIERRASNMTSCLHEPAFRFTKLTMTRPNRG